MTIRDLIQKVGPLTPGTVVQMTDGRELLVGHINPLGGVCDDCRETGEILEEETM